jgi:hypothetical protein
MAQVNDNYPKSNNTELTDAQLKDLALSNLARQEVKASNFPTEIISLPSKGLVYPEGNPLREGTIEMKYMTAREEDILTSQNLIKQGIVLDKLMQSMIVSPVRYEDLVIGDKNAIMVASRILGYGKDYPILVSCPKCTTENKVTVDLTQLPESNIPDDAIQTSPGVFEFTLPQSKRVIEFRLLTIGDDKKLSKDLEATKKANKNNQSVDRELTTRLKNIIVSVDGNSDRRAVADFVDTELFAMDSRALRTYMKDLSPDLKFEVNYFNCTECDHEEEAMGFNIDTNFFWPKS